MTQCKSSGSKEQGQMSLDLGLGKDIEAKFDGGLISSDGGLLLLRKADERLDLSELASLCVGESRRADLVKHSQESLFRQRIYAIACGYEDCNDAGLLRKDWLHQLAVGFLPSAGHELASQPTLSRWENSIDETTLKALQKLLVHTYVRSQKRQPKVIRLAMDTTCDETHGFQQLTFYNGFYHTDCYVPLFIFDDDGFPLAAVLRAGNAAPAEGALKAVRDVVHDLRLAWKDVRIELTADAGFALPELYEYCESQNITYFIGLKPNHAVDCSTKEMLSNCKTEFDQLLGKSSPPLKHGRMSKSDVRRAWRQKQERLRFASKEEGRMQEHFEDDILVRKISEIEYQSRTWSKPRRIIVRLEYTTRGPDVRYVVTNSKYGRPSWIYTEKYCRRARCENWIKEIKTFLKCDRTSCQEFKANQFRLLLHTFAYILIWEVKRKAGMKTATVPSVQIQLLKIGVLVKETARKVWLHLASEFPWQQHYALAWQNL